ncbi:MAG: hypothetical protein S4CHLAM81_01220 [Chlamydiales bacterium]|nr:hypothetical protein [Chlamydiales bacterium]MCH9634918.1 hypothetical protein [Chlamydiales bacterium]MCH9703388.1 hypothetical protein [Chlamydiota bacterium]
MASLHILEALDNLNALVDVDSIDQIEVTEDAQLVAHLEKSEDDYFLKAGSDEMTRDAIRETFKSVHEYLVHFYEKARENQGDTARLMEGINSVMVLVGEAANKLERNSDVFAKRMTDVPEYKQLQDFYKNRVIQELFTEFAKAPVVKPTEEEEIEEVAGVHLLNDIDIIKRDHLYELFTLKNEAGQDFYTPVLARNLKLACDFGQYLEHYSGDDPFVQVKSWEDRSLHLFAKRILNDSKKELAIFYQEARNFKEVEIVRYLHQAVVALHLAANPRNLLRQFSQKGCYFYFQDFQQFLRNAIHTREYERLLVYPANHPFFESVMALVGRLISEFFLSGEEAVEAGERVTQLIGTTKGPLSDRFHQAWIALEEAFANHPYGPVFKALDAVRDQSEKLFDPLLQGNIPEVECRMNNGTEVLRMPAPVRQRYINHAEVAHEWQAYLRTTDENHLLINYQDRTSWREHARSICLEELAHHADFADHLNVVTLAKDTEFYDQGGIYEELNVAEEFIQQFAYHLEDEKTGYYFPIKLRNQLLPTWTNSMLQAVHQVFFDSKSELSRSERLDFISIAYILMEAKLIEILQPSIVTHCCKDGLDVSSTSSAALIAFLKGEDEWTDEQTQKFFNLLFVPTMLKRERIVHRERLERLHSLFKRLEASGNYLQKLKSLFDAKGLDISPSNRSNRG